MLCFILTSSVTDVTLSAMGRGTRHQLLRVMLRRKALILRILILYLYVDAGVKIPPLPRKPPRKLYTSMQLGNFLEMAKNYGRNMS